MAVPIEVGQILQLKLVGNYNNQVQLNNIFQYEVSSLGTGITSPAFCNNFGAGFVENVLPLITAVTSELVTYTSLECQALDPDTGALINGETFIISLAFGAGQVASEALPPFVNWTFKLLRASSSFRHGFKRFSGVPEGSQNGGQPTSGVLTNLDALATQLADELQAWTILAGDPDAQITAAAAVPKVLKRFFNGDPLNPIEIGGVAGVVFDKIGSQNSRKFGVGV